MASGEVVIQSMWSPAVTAVRTRGIDCYYAPLKEGYRGWTNGLVADGAPDRAEGSTARWNTSTGTIPAGRAASSPSRAITSPVPETAKKFMTPDEWDYWYEGKPAAVDIKDPYGNLMEKKGATRDGGALWERRAMSPSGTRVMDEDRYLTRRWNEFISA